MAEAALVVGLAILLTLSALFGFILVDLLMRERRRKKDMDYLRRHVVKDRRLSGR
jgi:hypothetical protein